MNAIDLTKYKEGDEITIKYKTEFNLGEYKGIVEEANEDNVAFKSGKTIFKGLIQEIVIHQKPEVPKIAVTFENWVTYANDEIISETSKKELRHIWDSINKFQKINK